MLTAKEFKPDDSGFYSRGLYQWLKKHPYLNRVYAANWNSGTGYSPENKVLMIGIRDGENWFSGYNLTHVCRTPGNRQAFSYGMAGHRVSEWEDVTDNFIEEYRRIGKCHIYGDYAHEFKQLSKTKKQCIHCRKEFFRKSKRIIKHVWESKEV